MDADCRPSWEIFRIAARAEKLVRIGASAPLYANASLDASRIPHHTFTPRALQFSTQHTMDADIASDLTERFERYCNTKESELPSDILGELQSMLRLYSISAEELDFKWQAYSMKMGGAEETKLDLKTARDFRRDIQDSLERESREKAQARNDAKRAAPTPSMRGGKGMGADDVFGMYVATTKMG